MNNYTTMVMQTVVRKAAPEFINTRIVQKFDCVYKAQGFIKSMMDYMLEFEEATRLGDNIIEANGTLYYYTYQPVRNPDA